MIKSMTGFGRCEVTEGQWKITVEIKAVNHRYLDLNLKVPKKLGMFDGQIRTLLKEYIERGKVDVFVSYENLAEGETSLKYNKELASQYLLYLNQMAEDFGLENDIRVGSLSRYPDVFTMEEAEADEAELWAVLEQSIRGAAEHFVEARTIEGEQLKNDLIAKLDQMLQYVDLIEER